jgi:hypothetical protein
VSNLFAWLWRIGRLGGPSRVETSPTVADPYSFVDLMDVYTMKSLVMSGLFLLLLCGFLMPCYAAQNQLDGDWVGEFKIDGKTVYVRTRGYALDSKR